MVEVVLEGNKNVEMFQAMAIVNMKMGDLGLKVQSLKTRLTVAEGKKQGLLEEMKQKQEGYEEYKKNTSNWKNKKWRCRRDLM